MPYTYILFSERLNKYYIGACSNIERRIHEHNIGHSKFTSKGIPWTIVYYEQFETLALAKKREREIKARKPRIYIESLITMKKP